jgi:adenylate cyclase
MDRTGPDLEVLESWKEISRYLNRDIRTIQRWELERGLPVRRIPGGEKPRVYAVKSELDDWRRTRGIHTASASDRGMAATHLQSVAVLPFLNLGSFMEDQYFGDGLADEVITALSCVAGLRVIARTSSFSFRSKPQDIREIGRKLNAKTVLEGSVRRSGSRIRVTAQLVEAEQGYHLWSERFDRELTDIFSIQDEITRAIVEALRVKLTQPTGRVGPATRNLEAYHFWLKGRYHMLRQTPHEIHHSRELFERAIALDADFARAHLGFAESWWEAALFGLDRPRDAVTVGRPAVLKALEIDPALGDAHAMLGIYLGIHDFDWSAAERAYRRGLKFPSPQVHTRFAKCLLEPKGRLDEARAQYDLALESDPLSPDVHGWLAHHFILKRDFRSAEEEMQLAIELDPGYWWARMGMAGVRMFQGRIAESIAMCEETLHAVTPNPLLLGATGLLYGLIGDRERAEHYRMRLMEMSRTGYVSSLFLAWIHLGLGETEACLDRLEKAVQEREPGMAEFQPRPLYDALRLQPRFQALLSTMRLA